MPPRVTVFIPTWNRADYLGTAVRSALAQRFDSFEVLVVDDGSTDDTARVLAELADPRLRVEVNPRNLGIAGTHARGLELARGEYLAFLDSDEWAAPDRLARQVAFLDRRRDIAAVGSAFLRVDAQGRALGRARIKPSEPTQVAAWLAFHCPLHKPTVTARTTVLRRYGFTPDFRYYDDHDLWARMAMGGERLTSQPQVLGTYRRHPGQTTAQRQAVALEEKKRIAAPQLARLGFSPDDQDLARHVWLKTHHLAPPEALADPQYLRWAGNWLEALLAANARTRIYDREAFEWVVAQVWWGLLRESRKSGTSLPVLNAMPRPMRGLSLRRAAAARWWERTVRSALLRLPPVP